MHILAQGAEAIIYREGNKITKERFSKKYRHPLIDSDLRRLRTRHEVKILTTLGEIGFDSPRIYAVDENKSTIEMDFVEGKLVKDVFNTNADSFAFEMGKKIAQLHQNDIIHGDLTTSNMITHDGGITFIDFGLGYFSMKIEDKAVDLHLLDRALESTHFEVYSGAMEMVLGAYADAYGDGKKVVERFRVVQKRGRNKEKY